MGDTNFINPTQFDFIGIVCPHCGYQTAIDPALIQEDDPMPYCPQCDEPLLPTDLEPDFK